MSSDEQDDREANLFAMHLLVPSNMLRSEIQKIGGADLCDDEMTRILAKKFGVSLTLMAFRIGEEYAIPARKEGGCS